MDNAENEEDVVVGDQVVHDSIVADAKAMEGVCLTADRLHLLAADAAASSCGSRELFEAGAHPRLELSRKLLVGALGARRKPDLAGVGQPMSRSGLERPRR